MTEKQTMLRRMRQLVSVWRDRAEAELTEDGCPCAAALVEQCANELEATLPPPFPAPRAGESVDRWRMLQPAPPTDDEGDKE